MDLVLLSYLQATEEPERERQLGDLLLMHAAPIIRQVLRRKLGLYVNALGFNPLNADAEDLYHEVLTKVLQLLNDAQLLSGEYQVRSFRQYVTRVAANACHDHLRGKSPARSRLKNNLRDLFVRHPDFLTWKGASGEMVCGYTAWRGRPTSRAATEKVTQLEHNSQAFVQAKFPQKSVQHLPLTQLIAGVFDWVNGPVDLEQLVGAVARLLGVRDHELESLDDEECNWRERLHDQSVRCDTRLEARELLDRLWEEIKGLPSKQRDTFCLGFVDASGDDLFSLLLDAQVETLPQIARALDVSLDRLMALWREMPMDGANIAAALGATKQQVNKWRFRALQRLQQQLSVCTTK